MNIFEQKNTGNKINKYVISKSYYVPAIKTQYANSVTE